MQQSGMSSLYGDALSVSLHGKVYDKILRRITQLGNRDYIETLLSAQDRVVIQKGQFHQLMHHLGTIYTLNFTVDFFR